MELLDPRQINKERTEGDEESQRRTNSLAAEESRLAKQINAARDRATAEITRIGDDFKAFKDGILADKEILIKEVTELENRKTEALKPAEPIIEQAKETLRKAEEKDKAADQRSAGLDDRHQSLLDKAEQLQDREGDLDDREKNIGLKENNLSDREKRVVISERAVGDRWAELHVAVGQHNAKTIELDNREKGLDQVEQAQRARHGELDERENQIKRDRAKLIDSYEQLRKSKIEILGHE